MANSDDWHDDPKLRGAQLKGLTMAFGRVSAEAVQDPERRCHKLQVSWDLQFRTVIDAGLLAQLRAEAQGYVQDMISGANAAGIPATPQEIAQWELDFHVNTLVPEATYGHERQHRVAIRQAIDAALQPGGSLHAALEVAGRICTSQFAARQYARIWRLWFLRRLRTVVARGGGHDDDPATAKPPDGVGVPLPAGVAMPAATSDADWASDRAALVAAGYEVVAPWAD